VMVIEILLCVIALALLIPVSVLCAQVLMALPAYRPREMPDVRRPAVAILIPAHNEALMIADTLASIVPQLAAGDQLLVVADNCTDKTAAIASAAGAEVTERKDQERRGKGYALDFGIRWFERKPPEVVIIIDADCKVSAGTIDRLARMCNHTGRPVQALDLMHSPEGARVMTHIAEFAWVIKNYIRPLGYHRLGFPCALMGTGMAFPWPVIGNMTLSSGHLVEDIRLGIELTRNGAPPLFCPEAMVTSDFPATAKGIRSQRTRWEHGHLKVISEVPGLFVHALAHANVKLMALLVDLCVPPLALMMLLVLTIFAAGAAFFAVTGAVLPVGLAAIALGMLCSAVLLAWDQYGRHVISFGSLACAPLYVLGKLPVYWKFLVQRQVDWVRSRREGR